MNNAANGLKAVDCVEVLTVIDNYVDFLLTSTDVVTGPQPLTRAKLRERDVELMENRTTTLLADDMIMVTGEVERVTTFEKGLPNALLEKDGKIEKDPISDDQALVIHLRNKSLVVISGCSHAGIINTALYAKQIAGTETIHAVLGGFHLSGPLFEQIIEDTIKELKKINPEVLVPMHCSGWKAIQRFSGKFPTSFVLNSVGSKITLT